jgi:hypothetical protein
MAPSAAGQIWAHLAHDDERVTKQSKGSLSDALWPSLSREAKARAAEERRWANELAQRNKRLAADLRELRMRLRER